MMREVQSIQEWERVRARLSHDLLKNEIMPALAKGINILAGEVEDPEFEMSFARTLPQQVLSLCSGLEAMSRCAESCLSPRSYVDACPLSGLDDETKEWLRVVVHDNWKREARVDQRSRKAAEASSQVRHALARLQQSWERADRDCQELLESLAKELQLFSQAIADLKHLLPYHTRL